MRTKIEIKSYIKHSQKFLPYLIRHGVVLALLVVAILTFGLSMYGDKTPPVEKLEVNGIEKITDQLHLAKVPFGMESQLLDKAEIRAKFPIAKPPRLGLLRWPSWFQAKRVSETLLLSIPRPL